VDIVIAGGGIGGLAAALSLHAAGFENLTVHEAAREIRPLGVGVNLLPDAVRELTELGLADRLAAIGVPTAELGYRIAGQCSGLQAGGEGPRGSAR
jgi:2-polyprenyl-6-methoxyphenol hydroxylase-like FAD-dependent oxidoreductase